MKTYNVACYFINNDRLNKKQMEYYITKWGYDVSYSGNFIIVKAKEGSETKEIIQDDVFAINSDTKRLIVFHKNELEDLEFTFYNGKKFSFVSKSNNQVKLEEPKQEENEPEIQQPQEIKEEVEQEAHEENKVEEKKEYSSTRRSAGPMVFTTYISEQKLKSIHFGNTSCIIRKKESENPNESEFSYVHKASLSRIGDMLHFVLREERNGKVQFNDKYPLNKYEITDVIYGSDNKDNGIKPGFVLLCFKKLEKK